MTDIKDIEKRIRAVKAKIKKLKQEENELANERMRLKTGWMVGDKAVWHVPGFRRAARVKDVTIIGPGAYGASWINVSYQWGGHSIRYAANIRHLARPAP